MPNLNPANVMQIAAIADLYVIENLYKHCECYLLHFLSEYNACGLLSCIEESFVYSKMKYLRVTAVSIIATNFQSLKDTSEYCNLPDRVKLEISKLRESNLKYIDI